MKILVISLAGIGDTLFATPLIHELRENYPAAQLDVLVLWAGSRDVLEGNPHVNNVYQKNLLKCGKLEAFKYLGGLREHGYDVSFNTHPQSRVHYRLVARLVGATTRISHDYDHVSVIDRFLVNRTVPQDYSRHAIENNLALLELIGAKRKLAQPGYELFLTAAEEQWADDFLAGRQWSGRRLFALHVGSGGTKNLALRRWPLDHYVQLIRRINERHPEVAVLLMGGPEEHAAHDTILGQVDQQRVCQPETRNLRQAAALLKRAHVFLSVDTSLMHVAATVGVPGQIVIETPSFNKTVEPFGRDFILVPNPGVAGRNLEYYRYDGHGIKGGAQDIIRCMESVKVETVFAAVERALARR